MRVSGKEPYKVKSIIDKANSDRHMRDTQKQPWVGKFVTQHWSDPQISNNSYDIFGGRRGPLMVSVLDSGSSCPGLGPGRGHCVVFLGKTLYSQGASLHPGV